MFFHEKNVKGSPPIIDVSVHLIARGVYLVPHVNKNHENYFTQK